MTAYSCEIERLDRRTHRVQITGDGARLTFREVAAGWSAGGEMTGVFTGLIAQSPCEALFWEMPPLTSQRLDDGYECVLIDSPALARLPCSPAPFREHFGSGGIAVFDNLGADALLVAPAPEPEDAQYPHLAAFCRSAPPALSRLFWQRLGEVILERVAAVPTWVSTAGLGVGWLHARLDSRPKYYSHDPYRNWRADRGETDA